MKKIIFILILLISVVIFANAQNDPRKLTFPNLKFKPIKPKVEKIKEGILMYSVEDKELPIINSYVIFKVGNIHDPIGKEGLAKITFNLMLRGGTSELDPNQLEEKIDFLGSKISVAVNKEYSYINLWSLSKNFLESWNLLENILKHPRFDSNRFEVEKNKELEIIRRRWDEPRQIGFTMLNELIYGKEFPDIRRTTSSSINSISMNDIRSFYNNYILNREIIIGVAGNIEADKLNKLFRASFKDWRGVRVKEINLPKAKLHSKPAVYLINKEDLTQAIVCMGHLGLNRLDRDNAEISVLNFIYGTGGFNSQLLREIRSNRGLAYSAYGRVGLDRDLGTFISFTQTKNESVAEVIKIMLQIMQNIINNPVSEVELQTAINYEQNSFIHKFNSPQAILLESIILDFEGYPKDYLDTYISRIKKVTADKVEEMAKRSIRPNELIILVVGKKEEIKAQLAELNIGKVIEIELPKE